MDKDYLMLIIDGWAKKNKFLKDYFYREFKNANKEDITPDEFRTELLKASKYLREKINEPYLKQLERWNNYCDQESAKGNIVNLPMPKKNNYSFPLFLLTGGRYSNQISDCDVDYIEKEVAKGYKKIIEENPDEIGDSDKTTTSKLTKILQLYFEKECKPLSETQVRAFAKKNNISAMPSFINYWKTLKSNDYNHTHNTNNIKEFFKSYEALMIIFKDSNEIAFKEVEKRYKTLKDTYSDVAY